MGMEKLKVLTAGKLAGLLPRLKRYQYPLIVLLVGVLMLYAGSGARDAPEDDPQQPSAQAFDLEVFEAQLTEQLSCIAGIGQVELMLSLEESGEEVYASDVRQSANGADSSSYESTLSTVSDGSYGAQPVRVKQTCPVFRGAVVVCEGAGNAQVRLAVTDAVGALCDLGADRISVIQMKQQ